MQGEIRHCAGVAVIASWVAALLLAAACNGGKPAADSVGAAKPAQTPDVAVGANSDGPDTGGMGEFVRAGYETGDKNSDGFVDKAEIASVIAEMRKRFEELKAKGGGFGGGPPGGGPPGGGPSGGGQ